MLYFAYGSNMCAGRLRQRVPSAAPVCVARLLNHSLRFHKRSRDGSAKADAFFTGEPGDMVWGVVFEIDPAEKLQLDNYEGVGHGYVEKLVTVIGLGGDMHPVFMYAAEESHSICMAIQNQRQGAQMVWDLTSVHLWEPQSVPQFLIRGI